MGYTSATTFTPGSARRRNAAATVVDDGTAVSADGVVAGGRLPVDDHLTNRRTSQFPDAAPWPGTPRTTTLRRCFASSVNCTDPIGGHSAVLVVRGVVPHTIPSTSALRGVSATSRASSARQHDPPDPALERALDVARHRAGHPAERAGAPAVEPLQPCLERVPRHAHDGTTRPGADL
jgi:hypothetical protein